MIVWLDQAGAGDIARVGGKGANLGECVRAGLPVPPGFCVSTDAYRLATRALPGASGDAPASAAGTRERILSLTLPEPVRAAIGEAYSRLGEPPVAVRSSATAEDLTEASFAGQQDTYLGIVGFPAVLDAVLRCWASLWTDRAVEYRHQQGVPEEGIALAVVIQEMVAPDVAGVLFTRDPVSDDDATMLVSSAYGLGESVVAGSVTPDTFTLSRRPPAVVARRIGSKQTRIDALPGSGTAMSPVPEQQQTQPSLTDAQLLRLAGLGERVERHYRRGQDIEWALAGDELYLLQSRPITTGPAKVVGHAPVRNRLERALRDDLIEHFPGPFPLDLFAVHEVQGAIQDLFVTAGFAAASAASLVSGDDDGIVRINAAAPRPRLGVLTRLPALFVRGMRHDPRGWPDEERARRRRWEELAREAERLATASDEAALEVVRAAVAEVADITTARFVGYNAPMIVNRGLAARLIRWSGSEVTPEDLYAGVAYTSAEITSAVAELAACARRCGVSGLIAEAPRNAVGEALGSDPAGEAFQAHVEAFLGAHGARTARLYLPFSNRSWREDPESFYALLAASLRGTPLEPAQPPVDAVRLVEARLPRPLRNLWRANAARLRARHVGREASLYLIEEFFVLARAGMDEVASRLVARGQLDNAADIRFLYLGEVTAALAEAQFCAQPLVRRRRRKRGTAETLWWDRSDPGLRRGATRPRPARRGETGRRGPHDDAGTLRGLPASAGRASGVARVIRSPEEFHRLDPGEILVCPYTDPTWTPLFALAAAVVADSGGPLSHAAIVAREYGIPAVLGTGDATSLPDGATLLVDGTAGTVDITVEAP